MKIKPDIGPQTWITPLVGEDGRDLDTEHWWKSERILLVTSVRGGDMVHLLFYDRDDDEEQVPWGHEIEIGPDDLPLGANTRITEHDRVWTLSDFIGLASDRVPSVTNALASAYDWIGGDGNDAKKKD